LWNEGGSRIIESNNLSQKTNKIEQNYIMKKDLQKLINGSYGDQDLEFAGHPLDIERAAMSLQLAFELKIGFKEYLLMHEHFLKGRAVSIEHIEEQIEKVRDLSSYFIND
jgi:hypothetical protein